MLLETIRFAVYTICVIISFLLYIYLEITITNREEWGVSEGFFIIFPLLVIFLFGVFIENFKQIIAYPMIWAFFVTSIGFIESLFITSELPPEPDFFDLAFIEPFPYFLPYLLGMFGLFYLFFIIPLAIGFILGSIKRKIFT